MLSSEVRVVNRLGLHARAAARLVRLAGEFESRIIIINDDGSVSANAKSILSVLSLAACYDSVLRVDVDGKDEQAALDAIVGLFSAGFNELD